MTASGDYLEAAILKSLAQQDDEREPLRAPDLTDMPLEDDQEDPFGSDIEDFDAGCPQPQAPTGYRPGAKTGPKGVLADHKEFKRKEYLAKKAKQRQVAQKIKDKSMSLQLKQPTSDDEDDELDEDQVAMAAYRQQRIQEILDTRKFQSTQRPQFGRMREICVTNYVKEIDDEQPNVALILHLFQPHVAECQMLDHRLDELSRKFGYAKFLRILSTEASPGFDDIALPTVLVYKAGELVANLIRFTDEIQHIGQHSAAMTGGLISSELSFSVQDVEDVLRKHSALTDSDLCNMVPSTEYTSKLRFADLSVDSDEDE